MTGIAHEVAFTIRRGTNESRETLTIRHGVIAGWTGSDPAAVEHHIKELEAIGITPGERADLLSRLGRALHHGDEHRGAGERIERRGRIRAFAAWRPALSRLRLRSHR